MSLILQPFEVTAEQSRSDALCQFLCLNRGKWVPSSCVFSTLGTYFHWENGLVLCYRQIIDFKSQISWYNDTPNECCILNPQLWKLCFLRYQNQHRCSFTNGELDHLSLSLWDAQTSLRGICVRHWQRQDRWCHMPCTHRVWLLAAQLSCAPGPPLCWEHRCVTYLRWRVLLKKQSI